MKNSLIVSLVTLLFSSVVLASSDCSVSLFKTYTPRGPGKVACDEQNLPADFAGDLTTLASALKGLGYTASKYDQCAKGYKDVPTDLALVSQLGDCVQTGFSISCKLYVALIRTSDNKVFFENTIQGAGLGSVTLHISEALSGLPSCSEL